MPEDFAFNWTAVIILGAVGIAAIMGMFMTSHLLAPKRPSAMKETGVSWAMRP